MVSNHVVYMLIVQSIVQRIEVGNMHTIHFVPVTMNNHTLIRVFRHDSALIINCRR